MAQSEVAKAMKQICEEKGISYESVLETVEMALAAAYRKDYGDKTQNIRVHFNPETGEIQAFDVKEVAEDLPEGYWDELKELEEKRRAGELPAPVEALPESEVGEEMRKFNPRTQVELKDALLENADIHIGEELRRELPVQTDFGRMAAQTAKQVIIQRIREAERATILDEFSSKKGELVAGFIQRVEGKWVFVDLGRAVASLPPHEQIRGEQYRVGQRVKVVIVEVNQTSKGPEVIVSRTTPELVSALFALEVPEIAAGSVEIRAVAREAGSRSKIAVLSHEENIDPVGSCVGQRGSRVQTVIQELAGEKIDIIEWDENVERFIGYALSPAKVDRVECVEGNEKIARVYVKSDQLSLAIGRSGQNVRLAAKLTDWKIDIIEVTQSGTEVEQAENIEHEGEESREDGEAVSSDNKDDALPALQDDEVDVDQGTEETTTEENNSSQSE
ncbi:MAG: transcription termination factor NusA [Candidatus Jacksonbacteria bacterium RIFCSPLOWO2_01_FULL_44_13]|nr:MAG: transcription termination factor NusA [Candidatus Jacksonbacteria bacterium RIFCSPHIGHO2_02_FULL_43_10]OGY70735.1 MAG: transcription termination factor NusA [Candidatus Jacksonbacteria bacterium RIFCSPLOWO2_01_FULL_44_13]